MRDFTIDTPDTVNAQHARYNPQIMSKDEGKLHCEDCGSSPVPHRLQYMTVGIETVLSPFISLSQVASNTFLPLFDIFWDATLPAIFKLLAKIGVGKIHTEPTEKDFQWVIPLLWAEANRREIKMWQFLPFGQIKQIFVAEFEGKQTVFERMPVPKGAGRGIWWIDDKAVLKKHLVKAGLPVARGKAVWTKHSALKLFDSLQKPVIIKPSKGSGTRHTTLHISDKIELLRAFAVAKVVSPFVVIEEELVGAVYRPTLVGGKLIATIQRNQPQLVGDGVHTILELIAETNKHPRRAGPVFSPISIFDATEKELARQGYTRISVPKQGEIVLMHQKVNWGNGGTTVDVTDRVHEDNVQLFEQIAKLVEAPIVGIDFIIGDISKSWKEQKGCGVIECNSMPFIDTHHLPFEGEPRDIMGPIWDAVFPTSKNHSLPPLSHEDI